MKISLLWLLVLFNTALSIYEDQIGKFDWRQEYVGCPRNIYFERLKGMKSPFVFVSTETAMIASLKASTGHIILISVTKDGAVVRAWNRENGILAWEVQVDQFTPKFSQIDVLLLDGLIFICKGDHIVALSLSNGKHKWTTNISNMSEYVGSVSGSQTLTVVGGTEEVELNIYRLDVINGVVTKVQKLVATWFTHKRCALSDTLLQCFDDKGFYVADLSSDPISVQHVSLQSVVKIFNLDVRDIVVISTITNTYLYRVSMSRPPIMLLKFDKVNMVSAHMTPTGQNLLAVATLSNNIVLYDAVSGEHLFSEAIPESYPAPVKFLSLIGTSKEFECVVILEDCRFIYLVRSSNNFLKKWIRHEALSTITSVEMVDLPLSEAQADIESEFAPNGGGIVESFLRRLASQTEQFRRSCLSAANQIFSSNFIPFYSKSFIDWIFSHRFSTRSIRRKDAPCERDYFNLRKIIVVSTLKSIVYGIDSSDGTILWHFYLGNDMEPLQSSLGDVKIPLFIQRTTAHYQFTPLATVLVNNMKSKNTVVISFNPITGSLFEQKYMPSFIKRVEILPYANAKTHLSHLVLFDINDNVVYYPEKMDGPEQQIPLYLFNFNTNGDLEGLLLNVSSKQFISTWKMKLYLTYEQKIIAVVPKPSYQKIHSAGRVLGNRSVLYKYANPNLVAIAVFDSTHSMLQVYLIDAVSGYVVYSGKQNKIAGPVHLIHCENWLAYSYWNEKGRRMEIAIVELYEGLEQTDALHYNSLVQTLIPKVTVFSQAYIFPQGVAALGVTETEQGLSTRSLLVAMPFGGIFGISKRLLDPRRPLEMTQELAEEMLLPYRPELPIASEDFINYNQSVHGIRGFKTSTSGLESTSLMLAYGTDLFFTQLSPSGTFDILKDDFDHLLISVVLLSLVIGSLVCKKLGKNNSLKQAWQ
ncbi:unnamed protein product [Thelazia callipaeda]|uniref:ER membrane protein complex subunit 1 n=1 Tax=Thelazia callipaeda TaxID=103827 RepID=A0A0N5CZH1_THECL|nr:unnamed protein product [Thelazia callipaeda]